MDKLVFSLFLILAIIFFYEAGEFKQVSEKNSRIYLGLGIGIVLILLGTTVIKFFIFKR